MAGYGYCATSAAHGRAVIYCELIYHDI